MMEITLKNLKVAEFQSHDSTCFEATIYVDGKRAFTANDDGWGGCINFHPIGKLGSTERELSKNKIMAADAYCNTLPNSPCEWDENGVKMDLELFVGMLVEDERVRRDRKKAANKGVAFITDDKPNEIRWYPWPKGMPKTASAKEKVRSLWIDRLSKDLPGAKWISADGSLMS